MACPETDRACRWTRTWLTQGVRACLLALVHTHHEDSTQIGEIIVTRIGQTAGIITCARNRHHFSLDSFEASAVWHGSFYHIVTETLFCIRRHSLLPFHCSSNRSLLLCGDTLESNIRQNSDARSQSHDRRSVFGPVCVMARASPGHVIFRCPHRVSLTHART